MECTGGGRRGGGAGRGWKLTGSVLLHTRGLHHSRFSVSSVALLIEEEKDACCPPKDPKSARGWPTEWQLGQAEDRIVRSTNGVLGLVVVYLLIPLSAC